MSREAEPGTESDRADGTPHPRFTAELVGMAAEQAAFLEAVTSDRLHHAWLITGPQGIGKATLAWKIARFLLTPVSQDALFAAPPAATLATDPDTPLARRMAALSEPALTLLRRPWDDKTKKLKSVITVDEVRSVKRSFTLRLPDGGRRVVIVDSADEMNVNAANALLKLLEEPPANTVFLLISHMPSRLLPTIRSRCRTLVCKPLSNAEVARALAALDPGIDGAEAETLAALAGGSIGAAMRLHLLDGPALQRDLAALFASMPGVDRQLGLGLAGSMAARDAEDLRELFLQLTDAFLADLARTGVLGPAQTGPLSRLSPNPQAGRLWAEAHHSLTDRVRRGLAVNLDPHSLILDMVLRIDAMAGKCSVS